ncbi:MAG TPA: hybrid sensor histidine kinase/response regulator [Caldithrix abyssi]|uniref:histidine kinase n=1 Tax=Caldithrix abyssi TaxID=187145 RepID=A0A7V4WVC7_CALAY|nr:hybrid sensor histidine kinase/response regulator [Caldithrix abyssi]
MMIKRLKILFKVLFFFPFLLYGQKYVTQVYNLENGLPSTLVYDIAQDKDGLMWFSTRSGITSYDGVNWVTYHASQAILSRDFTHLGIDNKGTIWTTTQILEDGIFYLDGDSLVWINGPNEYPIEATSYNRITSFTIFYSTNTMYVAVGTLRNGLYLWDSERWINYSSQNSPLGNFIINLQSDGHSLYILNERGLIEFTGGKFSTQLQETYNLKPGQIYDISLEYSNTLPYKHRQIKRIWLLASEWIGYIDQNTLYTFRHNIRLRSPFNTDSYQKYCSLPDGHNGYLFSTNEQIFHFTSRREIRLLNSLNGIAGEGAKSFFMDAEKNIWFSNDRGVTKIPSFRLKNYTNQDGLLEDEVTAIDRLKDGTLIFGHNTGITFLNDDEYEYMVINIHRPYLALTRIMDIAVDSLGRIWIADKTRGVGLVKPDKTIKWFPLNGVGAHSLFVKSVNEIWAGTSIGIKKIINGKIESRENSNSFRDLVRNFSSAKDGSILIATLSNGLYVYKDGRWNNYHSYTNREMNSTYCAYMDNDGKLFVGTRFGLCTVQGDSFVVLKSPFSINRPVYFIEEDSKKNLWFGTDNGVYFWNGKTLRHINKNNGLAGNEMNRAAFLEDDKGCIWLGTEEGLSQYNGDYDHSAQIIPQLKLTSIQVNGRHLGPTKNIHLGHSENNLTIHFRYTSFRDESKVILRYKLEGFDNEWRTNKKITSTVLHYFNLPPGDYRVMMQLESVDRNHSPLVQSKMISIAVPFWQSWWFYFVLVSMLSFFLYYFVSYYSRLRYAKQLEQQIDLRTRQLRLSEMKYRSVFENSQDAVMISNPKGNIIDANPAALEMFGYDNKEEFLELSVPQDIYLDIKDREKFLKEIKEFGFVKDMELRLKRKDGAPLVVLLSSTLHKDVENGDEQYLTVLKDVTERWQLKEQLAQAQRMESIGMLAGGIAHDFNNILGGILGYASLMKLQMPKEDRFYKFVDSIEKSAVRGADLTNQLLVFAKRGNPQLTRVSINDIVKDSVKIIRSTFPKYIQIETNLAEDIPFVLSDEAQLHQVMMNLCVNARDAIEGQGTITINTKNLTIDKEIAIQHNVTQENSYVVVEVADTGVGIDPDTLKHIFEPFFSTKEQGKGSGLGLSMIYGFVHSQNGFIDVESTPGRGSIFRIFLPAIPGEEIKAARDETQLQKGNEVILIVDDEQVLRDFLRQALEGYGYTVLEADDGEAAVKIFKENNDRIQLIILDMIMPNMSGEKALFYIRQINSSIPVLVSSGYSDKDKFEKIAELGISGILHKPFRINKLLTQIRTILDN